MKKLKDIFGIILALFIAVVCVVALVAFVVSCFADFSLASLGCLPVVAMFFGMFLRGSILSIRDCIRKDFNGSTEHKYWK